MTTIDSDYLCIQNNFILKNVSNKLRDNSPFFFQRISLSNFKRINNKLNCLIN